MNVNHKDMKTMVDNEKITETKEKFNIKKEEKLLDANEKRTNRKIKVKEKILAKKQERNQKRLESHLNLAEIKVDDALDDADFEIAILMEEVEFAIAENEDAADLIMFRASNYMEEILLRAQLKIQMAKNQLIDNLERDLEDTIEVAILEENIEELKEKSALVVTTLRGKIDTEKEELKEKYGDE